MQTSAHSPKKLNLLLAGDPASDLLVHIWARLYCNYLTSLYLLPGSEISNAVRC